MTMKKQLFLFLMMLLPLAASADAVEIDGIYYNLITKAKVAEVTSNPNKYSGAVEIPETVTYDGVTYDVTGIGESAFNGCSNLTRITIPNFVTSIGKNAFQCCSGLTSLTIPNSVTSIGSGAFNGCTGLTSVTIPNSVTSMGYNTFKDCTGLTSVTIPNSVTYIGSSVFEGCSGLTSLSIPNSVTSIGTEAFKNCTGLTSVTIPNSVTSIGYNAFNGCTGLTSVTIPNSVTKIGSLAFTNCSGLLDVYCLAENVPSTYADAYKDSYIKYVTLHVPAASVNAYKEKEPWKNFKEIVPIEDVTLEKCATPTIAYKDGKLKFTCETEGAEFVSEVTVADAKKYYDAEVPLLGVYHVTAYATKAGYDNSDVATADFIIKGSTITLLGDVDGNGMVDATDITKLIDILLKRTN